MHYGAKQLCILLVLLIGLSVSGCFSPIKYGAKLDPPHTELHYGDLALSGDVLDKWWEAYGDAGLNSFINTVLKENISLQVAYLRLLDSQYALEQTSSDYYPSASLSAGVSYGGTISSDSTADPGYNLGASLSYEIDLWGKVRAQKVVSESAMYSAQDSAESAAMTLVANVVTQWFNIQYYHERKKLTEELLKLSESYYELVQEYYRSGQSTGMDVLEQNQQLESLRETIHTQDMNIRVAQRALEILAGGKVKPHVEGVLPQPAHVGGTVDVETLMKRRPDIRIALRSAQQADAKIVIAIANRFPSLKLSASLNFRASDITELFKQLLWSVGATIAYNLFDGFKQSAAVKRAKISYLQESLSYAATVMDAVAEVEQALLTMQLREQELFDAQAALDRQAKILEVSRDYYASGLIQYNRILSALKTYISNSQGELDARRSLILAQLSYFKAMGGGPWLDDVTKDGHQKAEALLNQLDEEDDNDDETNH